MRRAITVLFAILLCALPLAAEEPGQARGFDANKAFDFQSGIDTVNTFQGNLSLHLPIGPSYPVGGQLSYSLALSYNAKVWDYEVIGGFSRAMANRRSNVGMGWLLSLGRLIGPSNGTTNVDNWIYETPDGAEHHFWPTLHQGDPATPIGGNVHTVAYTRDGSYLRLIARDFDLNDTIDSIELESPDGLVRGFDPENGNLLFIKDRSSNEVTISYPPSVTGTPCPTSDQFAWVISDSTNARTTYVCFNDLTVLDSTYDGQVERVIMAAPPDAAGNARTSTYQFIYTEADIQRGCHSQYPHDPPVVQDIPMLTTILQNPGTPEEQAWSFGYNVDHTNNACESGTLLGYTLPTAATITYEYRYWRIPIESCAGLFRWIKHYPGIASRTISGEHIQTATWRYFSQESTGTELTLCADEDQAIRRPIPSEQLITTVHDPLGNVTEHYYSVWPMTSEATWDANGNQLPPNPNSPRGFRKREYGLPFTRMPGTDSAGRLLSRREYTFDGYFATPKFPLRSHYVTYEVDNNICTVLDEFCTDSNGRITAERIVYHDDNHRIADTNYSNFDGLGNFRQVATGGTFEGSNVLSKYVAFNERNSEVNPSSGLNSGTYPGSFTMPTLSDRWILNTSSFARVTEGPANAFVQTCYDSLTGFLRAKRVLKGVTRGSADLLVTLTKDGNGNLSSEAHAGGDYSNNAPLNGNLCATAGSPPTADYVINHTYTSGVRATSQYAGVSFLSLDQTVDSASGTVMSSRDTSGVITRYEYDRNFRLRAVRPTGVAATTYTYVNASGIGPTAVPARIEERTVTSTEGTVESHYLYDALGRLWRRKVRMPNNTWSYSETSLNTRGWPEWTSELQQLTNPEPATPSHKTFYSQYDPFGRPGAIISPDLRPTSLRYKGVSSVTRTVQISDGTVDRDVTTREVLDRHGRLRSVTEAYDTSDAVTTTYSYDVGGRLASVSMPGDNGPQIRTFQYDNRGFLEFEEQPELGGQGYDRIRYLSYDARGHARRRRTGLAPAFDISFDFDTAERLIRTRRTSTSADIALYFYDTGNQCPSNDNRCKGKLTAAGRFQTFDDLGQVNVVEHYQYNGPGFRMSRRDVAVGGTVGVFEGADFFDHQLYNELGHVRTVGYPCRLVNGSCTPRLVQNTYTNGKLTGVTGFASSISYQPNGAIGTIAHTNNVKDTITPDPHGLPRPCSLLTYVGNLQTSTNPCGYTIPASSPIQSTSGRYLYDGTGNIKRIGDSIYAYDRFSRLSSSRHVFPDGATHSEGYGFDDHGNRLHVSMEVCSAPVNGQSQCATNDVFNATLNGTTNHYEHFAYDDAGNVLNDGFRQFTYDALNRTKTAVSMGRQFRYIYGPSEERIAIVERVETGRSFRNRTTWTLRGFTGKLLSSWRDDSTSGQRVWTWLEDEIWRGSSPLASVNPTRTLHYSLDHLGSPRVVTDGNGQLAGTQFFAPFGAGGTSDGGFLQFTGQERDSAILGGTVDLPDSFHARQYDKAGRFLSVDPARNWSDIMKSPQSWNRYVYARNNPLRWIDPDGRVERDSKTIIVPVNIIYSNANVQVAWSDETLRQVTQQGIAYSTAFYGEAGIQLDVQQYEASIEVISIKKYSGTVTTPAGKVPLDDFMAAQPNSLTVVVTGDLPATTGLTKGIGGPTVLGVQSSMMTLNDELSHALGNVTGPANLLGNVWTDTKLDFQEFFVERGWGMTPEFRDLLRAGATQVIGGQ